MGLVLYKDNQRRGIETAMKKMALFGITTTQKGNAQRQPQGNCLSALNSFVALVGFTTKQCTA